MYPYPSYVRSGMSLTTKLEDKADPDRIHHHARHCVAQQCTTKESETVIKEEKSTVEEKVEKKVKKKAEKESQNVECYRLDKTFFSQNYCVDHQGQMGKDDGTLSYDPRMKNTEIKGMEYANGFMLDQSETVKGRMRQSATDSKTKKQRTDKQSQNQKLLSSNGSKTVTMQQDGFTGESHCMRHKMMERKEGYKEHTHDSEASCSNSLSMEKTSKSDASRKPPAKTPPKVITQPAIAGTSHIMVNPDVFMIKMDVSTFKAENVKVTIEKAHIKITGERQLKTTKEGYISKTFVRTYVIPQGVRSNEIQWAINKYGILTIKAPRCGTG